MRLKLNSKEIKKQVKQLAKQKEFEQIYKEYGPYYFREYVSRKYKKQDIKKLKQEGKYLDIYARYGKYLAEVYIKDIENEVGKELSLKQAIFGEKNNLLDKLRRLKYYLIGGVAGFPLSLIASASTQPFINEVKYEKEINKYQQELEEYAKAFDINSQSDMEIIMRTMKDMHETIKGYGESKSELAGYLGMNVIDEDGVGVCRNMAANIVDKLNEINPQYNARRVALYAKPKNLTANDIEYNQIEGDTRINVNANVAKTYINEKLREETIKEGDKYTTYQYTEDGNIFMKITEEGNQEERILYDSDGEILDYEKIITETKGNEKKEKIYDQEGNLVEENKKNKVFYTAIWYDKTGQVTSRRIADRDSERVIYYRDGKLEKKTLLKDGILTTIYYDGEGKEQKREKEETLLDNDFLMKEKIEKNSREKITSVKIAQELIGSNHEIVAIDIEKDNVTLIIDPTNLCLGVYKDGKIIIFNEQSKKGIYKKSFLSDFLTQGIKEVVEYPVDYVKSFREPTLSMEELEEKYGLEAQNKMLEQIEKEDNQKTFKEELKIDKGITYNFDTNVVTINNQEREPEENQKGK